MPAPLNGLYNTTPYNGPFGIGFGAPIFGYITILLDSDLNPWEVDPNAAQIQQATTTWGEFEAVLLTDPANPFGVDPDAAELLNA